MFIRMGFARISNQINVSEKCLKVNIVYWVSVSEILKVQTCSTPPPHFVKRATHMGLYLGHMRAIWGCRGSSGVV